MGRDKNGIGNRDLKELICTTRGHELRRGKCWRVWGTAWRRDKGGKTGKL